MSRQTTDFDFIRQLNAAFEERAQRKVFPKGSFLAREGSQVSQLYQIVQGAVKLYYLSEYGEKIIRLGYDGSLISELSSFFSGKPSLFYIEALRETTVNCLDKSVFQEVRAKSADYAVFIESVLVQQVDRELDLLIDSPQQRLERVLERSPLLFQHVPLKYIAAYLRMTPETLSRVRNS